jgi:glycylpeptide N-tetradecanoyltransferase
MAQKDDEGGEERQLTEAEAAIIEFMKQKAVLEASGGAAEDGPKEHKFWDTQPMPHATSGKDIPEGAIQPDKPKEEIRDTPYNMPAGFEWSDVDVTIPEQKDEVYELLAANYVEDDDCQFRFDYSRDFLEWALTPPGTRKEFLLGVRSSSKGKLVAFISAIPAKVQVRENLVDMVEINFLCVHKKLRSKRLAPVLIKEITRRVNLTGVFQAVYTAGVVLPVPVGSARYFHRSLNPKKLVNVGFSRLPPRMTMARMQKLYKLPATTSTPNLRAMTGDDVEGVHTLLTTYLKKFPLHVAFTSEEVAHWLLPRPGVIDSFVVTNGEGTITDMCSYYHLPSSILGFNDTLHAAYSFYNVATSVDLTELMRDSLIMAKKGGSDVFNALNLMENERFLEELKFGKGDGNLQYYLYNWACPAMESKDIGIVLL